MSPAQAERLHQLGDRLIASQRELRACQRALASAEILYEEARAALLQARSEIQGLPALEPQRAIETHIKEELWA